MTQMNKFVNSSKLYLPAVVETPSEAPSQRSHGLVTQRVSDLFASDGQISAFEKFMIDKLGGAAPSTGIAVTTRSALSSTAVWCATSIRSQSIAMLPLAVYRKLPNGGRVRDDNHYLTPLLSIAPNDEQTSFNWKEMSQNHLCFRGNHFSQIVRANGGTRVTGIYPLHPDHIMLFRKADLTLEYLYSPVSGGSPVALDPVQVLHIPGKTYDGLWGISPIQACANAIGVALALEQFGGKFFSNAARPSGVVELDGELDEPQYESFKKEWRSAYSGENMNTVAILEKGVKWKPLSITNDEAQFLDSRKFQVPDIGTRIFFVPPVYLGDYADAHFANMEQAALFFIRTCIRPELRRYEAVMNMKLLTKLERQTHCIGFNDEDLLMTDAETTAKIHATARQWGWESINDVRLDYDDTPIPDGDKYESALNMVPVDFDRAAFFSKKNQQSTPGGVPGDQGQTTEQDKNAAQPPKGQNSAGKQTDFEVRTKLKTVMSAVFSDYFERIKRKEDAFSEKNGGNQGKLAEFRAKHADFMTESLKAPVLIVAGANPSARSEALAKLETFAKEHSNSLSEPVEVRTNELIALIFGDENDETTVD